jgi:hypothetical protein
MRARTLLNTKSSTIVAGAAGLTLGTLAAVPASADIINFQLTTPNSAISPYPSPYANVQVNQTGNTATITFTSLSSGGFRYLFIDSSIADVNVNASSWTISNFSDTTAASVYPSGGFASTTGPTNGGSGNVDGFGRFNQTTNNPDGTDQALTEVDFKLTDTGGTWTSASNVLTPNGNGAEAAAHIVVFSSTDVVNGSQLATGYVAGNNNGTPIVNTAEPGSLALLGSALAGLALLFRRRQKLV